MIVTPENCTLVGEGLDHPESVCVDPQGVLYAGGEAGQVYRIEGTSQREIATTGGFLLGVTLDGHGAIHACDCGQPASCSAAPRTSPCTTAASTSRTWAAGTSPPSIAICYRRRLIAQDE